MNLPINNSFEALEIFFSNCLSSFYSKEEIKAIFYLILETEFNLSKTRFILEKKISKFSESEINKFNKIIGLLKQNQPIQYILGRTTFYSLPLKVNKAVLIPRPETEELVDWIIGSVKPNFDGRILDIGTGSGAIALAIKNNLPNSKVYALDVSPEALEVARTNANSLKLNINFLEENILNVDLLNFGLFDIIVSNPPYVLKTELEKLAPNVKDFEPHLALFVESGDPLIFYKRIIKIAKDNLSKSGLLFFEINEDYGNQMVELLDKNGFKDVELRHDLNGKNRMIKASPIIN